MHNHSNENEFCILMQIELISLTILEHQDSLRNRDKQQLGNGLLNKHLSFRSQISNVCKSAFYALNNIRKICKYLDSHSTERLIHAFRSSRIDNCNSLFCGLPVAEIAKLQRVQNAAARLFDWIKANRIYYAHTKKSPLVTR